MQRNILHILHYYYYVLIADETVDVSNTEPLVIFTRWVDEDLEVHIYFVEVHPIENTKAETISAVLKVRIITWVF